MDVGRSDQETTAVKRVLLCDDTLREILIQVATWSPWIWFVFSDNPSRNYTGNLPRVLSLKGVNRQWYRILDTTAEVWANLHLVFGNDTTPPRMWGMIDKYLSKSKDSPLHLRFSRLSFLEASVSGADLSMWKLSFSRWASIRFGPSDYPDLRLVSTGLFPSSAPKVSSIFLEGWERNNPVPTFANVFPNLQTIEIQARKGAALKFGSLKPLPHRLTRLHIQGEMEYSDYPASLPDIELPCLRTLVLHITFLGMTTLVRSLTCPALQDVNLAWAGPSRNLRQYAAQLPDVLTSFVQRSRCQIQRLSLHDIPVHVLECIHRFPALRHLELSYTYAHDKHLIRDFFIRLASVQSDEVGMLPKLKNLFLIFCPSVDVLTSRVLPDHRLSLPHLLDMCRSRLKEHAWETLGMVTVEVSYLLNEEEKKLVRCFEEEIREGKSRMRFTFREGIWPRDRERDMGLIRKSP